MQFSYGDQSIGINVATGVALEQQVRARFRDGRGFALATVNLDHLVKMKQSMDFRDAYAQQNFVVADGRPIVWLSRLAGRPVELLPGSDLILPLCRWAAAEQAPVALLGSTAVVLDRAAQQLMAEVPGLDIRLKLAPSHGFDPKGAEAAQLLTQLNEAGIRLCFLALGAPKQEQLAVRGRAVAPATGFASIGAGLDFIGGGQRRAPRWVRRIGLEWLWRALGNPLRLGPRYARCAAILPGETARALRQRRRG